jgi:hypothetical protein
VDVKHGKKASTGSTNYTHMHSRSNSSTLTTFPVFPDPPAPNGPLSPTSPTSPPLSPPFSLKSLPPPPPGGTLLRRGRSISVDEFGRPVPNFSRKYSIDIVMDPTASFVSERERSRSRPRTGSASQQEVRNALRNAFRESLSYKWAEETLKELGDTGKSGVREVKRKVSLTGMGAGMRSRFNKEGGESGSNV